MVKLSVEQARQEHLNQSDFPKKGEPIHPALARIVELLARQAVEDYIEETRKEIP